ncbi:MAG: family 10 glycosylhydrolase [Acidobacteriota bacterium]|nr:MAG: family 10 glycosylhydrolase [Acidobacteriota bacterium]
MKTLAAILIMAIAAAAQQLPDVEREFRGVWIATVDNIDFPTKKGLPVEDQKCEIIEALDLVRSLRMNAVIFQVRPMTDAVYASKIEPWSEFLTGEMGRPQAFDPLEFLTAEAHRRGIQVHAWFNPFRAFHPAAKTVADSHVSKTRPDITRQYGRYMWLDPTERGSREHSLRVIKDVVRSYRIDAVHFDDYFYPYAERDADNKPIDFPDEKNWQAYLRSGGKMTRPDWRRWHVNTFIEQVGREIKKIRRDVIYGISPFGIWQPMPERDIAGFNAYAELYADARKWLQDGTVDYLAPQLYWETARKGLSFPVLLDWWLEQNTAGRHIWPGIAAYRIGANENMTAAEIASQIARMRSATRVRGGIFFSHKSLRNDLGGIQNVLRNEVFRRDAVLPDFPWIKSSTPKRPRVRIERGDLYVRANWNSIPNALQYVVYVRDDSGWSYSVLPAGETTILLSAGRGIRDIVVKTVSRAGKMSK